MSGTDKKLSITKQSRSLTLALREKFPPELLADMYFVAMSGRRPLLVEDKRCALGYRAHAGEPISPELQHKYMTSLLDREWGQPPQQIQLEASVQGQLATMHAVLDPETLQAGIAAGADPVALLAIFRQAALGQARAQPVIDVASREVELVPADEPED